MPAARYDIEIEQGATFRRVLTLKENDVAINLAGYTAKMQVREEPTSTTALADMTINFTGNPGEIELLLSSTLTQGLPSGIFYYDLLLTSAGGEADRWLEGKARIDESVSR
jgi:hypothetical protein